MSLFELRAITAAVESSGQKKAEAQVRVFFLFPLLAVNLFVSTLSVSGSEGDIPLKKKRPTIS